MPKNNKNTKEVKKSNKKTKQNKKTKNSTKPKIQRKQITIEELYKLSDIKKLFILRESLDLLSLGVPVNQEVIDVCYEDLVGALQDYEWLKNEWEHYMDELNDYPKDVDPNNYDESIYDQTDNGAFDGEHSPEIDSDTIIKEMTLQELTQQIYGESWQKLEDGLDQLNEKHGTYYRVYMYPQMDGKTIKLKVFDDHDVTLKRVYDDKYDLDINLEQDIKSNFSRPKISLSTLKLSDKKEENIE